VVRDFDTLAFLDDGWFGVWMGFIALNDFKDMAQVTARLFMLLALGNAVVMSFIMTQVTTGPFILLLLCTVLREYP
jgi:hypothetical protein